MNSTVNNNLPTLSNEGGLAAYLAQIKKFPIDSFVIVYNGYLIGEFYANKIKEKTLSNIAECKARNAKVIGIITEGDEEAESYVDHAISVPSSPQHTSVISSTVALQLFAYHIALLRGCPIDQPKNLAKSVTVE